MSAPIPNACLRLLLPRSLEDQVVDFLLQHPDKTGAFIAYGVDGHGTPEAIRNAGEEVRGRSEQIQMEILTRSEAAQQLLAELKRQFPNPAIRYWLAPVQDAGRF